MPIEVICKGCSRKLRVADENAGKLARCPSCGETFTVPTGPGAISPSASLPSASAFAPTEPFAPTPAPTPYSGQANVDRWFLKTEAGVTYGPASRAELDSWVAEGRATAASLLLREGDTNWQPAKNVYPTLVMGAAASPYAAGSPPPNPFADPTPGSAPNPYTAPTAYGSRNEVQGRVGMVDGRYVQPHRGGAVLTLGILGLCLCQFLGIAAVVMAAQDLKLMNEGRMDASGKSMTIAGMVLGIISIVILALWILGSMAGGFN